MEYKGQKCVGYNISASFINNEKDVITGSEDNRILIFDKSNGFKKQEIKT